MSPTASRSPTPGLRNLSELAGRCRDLQTEATALKGKVAQLELENDDLRLRLATGSDTPTGGIIREEVEDLRSSVESLGAQNRTLATEVEIERRRSRAIAASSASAADGQSLQLAQALQQLEAERQRSRVLAQAVEAERRLADRANQVGGTVGAVDAAALTAAKATIANLQAKLDEMLQENVRLRREAISPAFGSAGAAPPPQEVQELRRSVEDLVRENVQLRRSGGPGPVDSTANAKLQAAVEELTRENVELRRRAAGQPADLAATAGRLEEMRKNIEELTRENVELRRRATGQLDLSAASSKMEDMRKSIEELMQENIQLRRSAPALGTGAVDPTELGRLRANISELTRENVDLRSKFAGQPDAAAMSFKVAELTKKMEELMQENVALMRRSAEGGSDMALAAARRQVAELQARMEELVRENVQLQRSSNAATPAPRNIKPGTLGVGALNEAGELGELRRLHDENRAQRRVLELALTRSAAPGDAAAAAFAALAEECQRLDHRLAAVCDENAVLRLRLPPVSGDQSGGLPAVQPSPPGSLQEAQEANALLRNRFDVETKEHAVTVRRLSDASQRIDELLGECTELRRRAANAAGAAPAAASGGLAAELEAHRQARERMEAELDKSERGRAALERQLSAQTARVAELWSDREALQQRLHEAKVRLLQLEREGAAGPVGLQGASTAAVRERGRLERQVDSLENENTQLRSWADKRAERDAERATKDSEQLQGDTEALRLQIERLGAKNGELIREADELRRVAATASLPWEEKLEAEKAKLAKSEEEKGSLVKKLEELRKEISRLDQALAQQQPQVRRAVLDTAKQNLEDSGVTFLQVLRALDTERSGRLALRTVEGALRHMPLQLPGGAALKAAVAEAAKPFQDADGTIRYVEMLEDLLSRPSLFASAKEAPEPKAGGKAQQAKAADGALSPRSRTLKDARTLGIVDEVQRFRGFSLRSALAAVDEDQDGLLSSAALERAFGAFFEFFSKEELGVLLSMFEPQEGNDKVHWLDCVWKLDLAFIAARDHIDAMQAMKKHAKKVVAGQAPPHTFNPLRAIQDCILQREVGGERGALKQMFSACDPKRSGFLTKRAFRALLREEVGIGRATDEELDLIFEEIDVDGDNAITMRELEIAVTGDDRQRHVTETILKVGKAMRRMGLDWGYLLQLFDTDGDGELDRQELAQMLCRMEYRPSEAELDLLMDELDRDASGTVSLAELKHRIELAENADLIDEFKDCLRRVGVSPIDEFFEADADGSGTVSFKEFEDLFLGKHRLGLSRARLRELFNLFDIDRNGEVTYREFLIRCGLHSRRWEEEEDGSREYLPRGDGPAWAEDCLVALKRAVVRWKREGEDTMQAVRRALAEHDIRGAGAVTPAQLRRCLGGLGLDADLREAERLCELLRAAREPRGARSGSQPQRAPRGAQQGAQRGGAGQGLGGSARELRLDAILSRVEAVRVPEEAEEQSRLQARPAAEALRVALQRRGLSLVAILADLDPGQHGRVLFESFRVQARRQRLGLEAADLQRLEAALQVDARGLFATQNLVKLVGAAEEAALRAAEEGAGRGNPGTTPGVREALEGLPPAPGAAGAGPGGAAPSAAERRRGRSTGGLAPRVPQAGPQDRDWAAAEARHRRQMEALNTSLRKAEEERTRLQREVNELQRQVASTDAKREEEEKAVAAEAAKERTKPLRVLLSAGDGAPPVVKELKLEVRSTRELRDKLYRTEQELEDFRRRLEVDARKELEKERKLSEDLRKQLEEKERVIADLNFDLRRARAAAAEDDWAQREEEYMRLNLQNRKLEEELDLSKRTEAELSDRLLEREHQAMELRFEREQAYSRTSRLEGRILELELLVDAPAPAAAGTGTSANGPASSPAGNRKDAKLEHVVESLERVITQQKAENQRLKNELESRRDDRRHKVEVERLRKRIMELEAELGTEDRRQVQLGRQVQQGAREAGQARHARAAAQAELEEKERRIAELEARLRRLSARDGGGAGAAPAAAPAAGLGAGAEGVGLGADPADVGRLQEELSELRAARSADAMALDEAQRALQEAELTERRYLEVARENKQLRANLGALGEDGFWHDVEDLQARNDEAVALARESKEVIERIVDAFPSVDPPTALLVRLDRFAAAAAAAPAA